MISRMTMSQTTRGFLADLQANSRLLDRSQHQVSTGKRITTPADDAIGISAALRLRNDRSAGETYAKNIDDSLTWLSATDVGLSNGIDVIHRARDLAVQGASGALSQQSRGIIADEIDQLVQQMVEVGNAALGGRYLFAGTDTLAPPFTTAGVYTGNTGQITREVELGSTVRVNTTGNRLAGPGAPTPDIFTTLTTLAADLRAGNVTGVGNSLANFDAHLTNVNALRGEVGGKINKLEMSLSRQQTFAIAAGDQLSKIEDVDMAKAITDLKTRENVYRASLGVGGRVLPPSLLDFLN
jgi:flagellar hook-associated protein 3 FlgL